ncbi:uncharacterized protein LOC129916607 isoform X2 [Episyrphus balteatus]|nr:uncharacterized protein LOC129916607 isoform X2 [Episyrphus balteatus]
MNNKRFQQLMFVLKEMLYFLFQKSTETNISVIWGLELISIYNRCSRAVSDLQMNGFNLNVSSNTYPNLLQPQSNLNFGAVLQLLSQRRIEPNILEILLDLLNMHGSKFDELKMENDCSPLSLEVLKSLTQNLVNETDFLKTHNIAYDDGLNEILGGIDVTTLNYQQQNDNVESDNVSNFIFKVSMYITNLIWDCRKIVPSVFDEKKSYDLMMNDAIKTVWTYITTILDHVILWWIETPVSCFSLTYVDSIRDRITSNSFKEPSHSSLRALREILTLFASNNVWDKMFRITLVTSSHSKKAYKSKETEEENVKTGTYAGTIWNGLFNNLKTFNNFLLDSATTGQVAVAEQIPILHRIDHSIHSMRIWVNEQCKLQCSQWIIDIVFQLLYFDVRDCLATLSLMDKQVLSLKNADIPMTVCISLRAKLLVEINANISKLQNITEECITILSSVCRTLSLANFSLSFPSREHWQQNVVVETKCAYVSFILDQIFSPVLKATNDIMIQELILKLICEAWIDYIFSKRVKFSTAGALALINDFDEVKKWILKTTYIPPLNMKNLVNHEVLHMCKGVGKVLVRKPKEMIAIVHSPKHRKSSSEEPSLDTQLPSEMFVSNQSNWLQLKASSGKFSFSNWCYSTHDKITNFDT